MDKVNWDKIQAVSIHRPGRVVRVYKDREDGWCVLLQVSNYLLHRYIHLPGRPIVEVGRIVREILCEDEQNG